MKEVFGEYTFPKTAAGFNETCYSSRKCMPEGIEVSEDEMTCAMTFPKVRGLQISSRETTKLKWNPFLGAYHADAYLLGSSVVVIDELKTQDGLGLTSFPQYVLSMLSQSKDELNKTAKRLKLPLPLEPSIEEVIDDKLN